MSRTTQSSQKSKTMKHKYDWVASVGALSIGYLTYVILTKESLIFPAFVGALMVHFAVMRIARTS